MAEPRNRAWRRKQRQERDRWVPLTEGEKVARGRRVNNLSQVARLRKRRAARELEAALTQGRDVAETDEAQWMRLHRSWTAESYEEMVDSSGVKWGAAPAWRRLYGSRFADRDEGRMAEARFAERRWGEEPPRVYPPQADWMWEAREARWVEAVIEDFEAEYLQARQDRAWSLGGE